MSKSIINNMGYYDDTGVLETSLVDLGMIEEMFFLKDLKQRKLFLQEDIEDETVYDIVRHIMQYNKEDIGIDAENRTPIILYIVTRGGDIEAGLALIDVIQSSKTPVYTVNLGCQYSMGFEIGLAGHKRYATRNARYLMHDGAIGIADSGSKVRDYVKFHEDIMERIKAFVLSRSNITSDDYDSKVRKEWYMFAEEAKQYGFIDYIIGEDCDISEII